MGRHLTTGLARLGAAAALMAMLVALPVAVVSLVGLPQRGALADAFGTGRLDDTAIVHIGMVLFLALWAWFALTALAEIMRIASWRGRPRPAPLRPITASPGGWVRRLVRIAMISSTAVVGSGLAGLTGTSISSAGAAGITSSATLQSAGPVELSSRAAPANTMLATAATRRTRSRCGWATHCSGTGSSS